MLFRFDDLNTFYFCNDVFVRNNNQVLISLLNFFKSSAIEDIRLN